MASTGNDEATGNGYPERESQFREPKEQILNRNEVLVQGKNGLEDGDNEKKGVMSIKMIFKGKEAPTWRNQLTIGAFVVSFLLGLLLSVMVMKFNLTIGTKFLERLGMLKQPFTRQENTVIQTCVIATSGVASCGGFGSYLFAMSETISKKVTEANDSYNTKSQSLGWIISFLFTVSFLDLYLVLPLRKVQTLERRIDVKIQLDLLYDSIPKLKTGC